MVRWFTILGFYEALEVVLFLVFISVKVVYSLKIQITFLNKEGRHPVLLAGMHYASASIWCQLALL